MTIKRFCNFCKNEITNLNCVPKGIDFSHYNKSCKESEDHKISIEVILKEHNKYDDADEECDVCKDCLKEITNQM
jgi:hypothetical protein